MKKYRLTLNKLIRDQMPEILQNQGCCISTRIMNSSEYMQALKEK